MVFCGCPSTLQVFALTLVSASRRGSAWRFTFSVGIVYGGRSRELQVAVGRKDPDLEYAQAIIDIALGDSWLVGAESGQAALAVQTLAPVPPLALRDPFGKRKRVLGTSLPAL